MHRNVMDYIVGLMTDEYIIFYHLLRGNTFTFKINSKGESPHTPGGEYGIMAFSE